MMGDLVDRLQWQRDRLADLLSDLLDVDRLERGILEPHRRRTLLRDLVDRALVRVDARPSRHRRQRRRRVRDGRPRADRADHREPRVATR